MIFKQEGPVAPTQMPHFKAPNAFIKMPLQKRSITIIAAPAQHSHTHARTMLRGKPTLCACKLTFQTNLHLVVSFYLWE